MNKRPTNYLADHDPGDELPDGLAATLADARVTSTATLRRERDEALAEVERLWEQIEIERDTARIASDMAAHQYKRVRVLLPLARAAVAINAYWQSEDKDFVSAAPVVYALETAVADLSADVRAELEATDGE